MLFLLQKVKYDTNTAFLDSSALISQAGIKGLFWEHKRENWDKRFGLSSFNILPLANMMCYLCS